MNDASQPARPVRFRFTQRMRLKSAGQFRAVYEARLSHGSGPLVIYARPNDLGHLRLGLSVSRRVGGAVVRNRIKRRLREAFRLRRHDLPAGYDVVINVRPHEPLEVAEYQRLLNRAMRVLDEEWTSKRHSAGKPTSEGRASWPAP